MTGSIRAWAVYIGRPYFWSTWAELDVSVRTGRSAFRAGYGLDPWAFRRDHPEENAIFNAAMTELTAGVVQSIVAAYDFSALSLIVDVGGGEGALLAAILAANPAVRGILFDQQEVVGRTGAVLRQAGVHDRCEVVGGSFFETVPPRGDAYILKSIVHDWDDASALTILQVCRTAVAIGGHLLLVERVLGPANQPDATRFADLSMLLMLDGRERGPADFAQLCEAARFRLNRILPTSTGFSIIEARAV